MDSTGESDREDPRARTRRIARTAVTLPEAQRVIEVRERVRDDAYTTIEAVEALAWRIYESGDL